MYYPSTLLVLQCFLEYAKYVKIREKTNSDILGWGEGGGGGGGRVGEVNPVL